MKDILTDQKFDSFIIRLHNLNPEMLPKWGSLSVNGMLRHCIIVTDTIISSIETRKPNLKEFLLSPVFYLLKRLPKNFQSGSKYLASDVDLLQFETEKENLIKILNSLKNHNRVLLGVHPVFGPLNTNQWRKFLLIHTDHHLRQFHV